MNKQYRATIILAVFLVGVIIALLLTLLFTNKKNPSNQSTITPTPTFSPPGDYGKEYRTKLKQYDQAHPDFGQHSSLIAGLYNKLPFKGNNVTFVFDTNSFQFIATINKNNKSAGDSELDSFLKSQRILSRDWFTNLDVVYK